MLSEKDQSIKELTHELFKVQEEKRNGILSDEDGDLKMQRLNEDIRRTQKEG